jgi:hypothetical protein
MGTSACPPWTGNQRNWADGRAGLESGVGFPEPSTGSAGVAFGRIEEAVVTGHRTGRGARFGVSADNVLEVLWRAGVAIRPRRGGPVPRRRIT